MLSRFLAVAVAFGVVVELHLASDWPAVIGGNEDSVANYVWVVSNKVKDSSTQIESKDSMIRFE